MWAGRARGWGWQARKKHKEIDFLDFADLVPFVPDAIPIASDSSTRRKRKDKDAEVECRRSFNAACDRIAARFRLSQSTPRILPSVSSALKDLPITLRYRGFHAEAWWHQTHCLVASDALPGGTRRISWWH